MQQDGAGARAHVLGGGAPPSALALTWTKGFSSSTPFTAGICAKPQHTYCSAPLDKGQPQISSSHERKAAALAELLEAGSAP